VTLGATFLVYTGFALALRRLARWWRAPRAVPMPVPAPTPVPATSSQAEIVH